MAYRAKKLWITSFMAGMLLFAQFAMAGPACMRPSFPHEAPQQATQEQDCDGMPMEAPSCKVHCLEQDQAAPAPDQQLHAYPASIFSAGAEFALATMRSAPSPLREMRLPAGPPLQVLFCSYLA